ncbi:MAG: 4Fe-4S binding protein [Sporomusaceae bacterium]|nr:4Fe-4S binding protein [Sporomusaceae bacterium]
MCAARIHQELCYAFCYSKSQCSRCCQECPKEAIRADFSVVEALCDDCGLCSAVCPADAISLKDISNETWSALFNSDCAVVTCQGQDSISPFACLGFLDFRLLTASILKYGATIVVHTQKCLECRPTIAPFLEEQLKTSFSLLPQEQKKNLIWGAKAASYLPKQKMVSRRTFFKDLCGSFVKTTSLLLQDVGPSEPIRRKERLRDVNSQLEFQPTVFSMLKIDQTCTGCGLCVKLCPEKALKILDFGQAIEILEETRKCYQCNLCIDSCPVQALAYDQATTEEVSLARIELPRCEQCGSVYQPVSTESVCLECRFQQKNNSN